MIVSHKYITNQCQVVVVAVIVAVIAMMMKLQNKEKKINSEPK